MKLTLLRTRISPSLFTIMWLLHSRAEITANDHGPLVNVAAWILMCMSVLFTSFRLVSNLVLRGTASRDDCFIIIATLLAVAQVIATSLMVTNGLGKLQTDLRTSDLEAFQKALIASSTTYVAALAFGKLSILSFLGRVIANSQRQLRLLMQSLWYIVSLYLVRYEVGTEEGES